MANPILDADRVEFLRARSRVGKQDLVAWPRHHRELDLVEVEVSWVRFSTLNHRTKAEQLKECQLAKDSALFRSNPLGPKAQAAQYKILTSQDGFAALKKDLTERGQQEPAVVTADGVLINGNRRAAALRSLFTEDNVNKAKYVKCLVLPEDATPAELLDLEAELQVAKDFKEEYSWVNEAMLIEELYEREGKSFERVAKRMHRPEQDVRGYFEKLQQLHQLVAISGGARQYLDFTDNESAFDELAKHVRGKVRAEADSVRSAYFLGTLTGVNYRKLRHLRRKDAVDLIRSEIDQNPALVPLMSNIGSKLKDDEGLLDELLGESPDQNEVQSLISFFASHNPGETVEVDGQPVSIRELSDTVASTINAAAKEAEEESKDKTTVTAPIVRLKAALDNLERARVSLPKAMALPEWDGAEFQIILGRVQSAIAGLTDK